MVRLEMINGTEQLVPVLEEESIDRYEEFDQDCDSDAALTTCAVIRLFPTASAVLAEMDLSLSRSAVMLTVRSAESDRNC